MCTSQCVFKEGVPAGSDGAVCVCDLSSTPSPHPLTSTPLTPHSLITAVSSNHFAVIKPGGVISLRDTMYGTCQASMETSLVSVTMVTPVLYNVIGAVITFYCATGVVCVWPSCVVWRWRGEGVQSDGCGESVTSYSTGSEDHTPTRSSTGYP